MYISGFLGGMHMSIQSTFWQQILWTRIWYIRAPSKTPSWYSLIFCNANRLYNIVVASPVARHRYWDIGVHCLSQPNLWLAPCASGLWTALRKFGILSAQRARVGKNIYSSQPKDTFPLSTGVSRPYLRQCQARRPRLLVFFSWERSSEGFF